MAAKADSNVQPINPKKPTKAQLAELGARFLEIAEAEQHRPPPFKSLYGALSESEYLAQRPSLQQIGFGELERLIARLRFLSAAIFEHDQDAPFSDGEQYGGKLMLDELIDAIEDYDEAIGAVLSSVPADAIPPETTNGSAQQAEG